MAGVKTLAMSPPITLESDCISQPYIHLIQAFAKSKDTAAVEVIHDHVVARGLNGNSRLADQLIHMYTKCGRLDKAVRVFQEQLAPETLSWNRIISAYVALGKFRRALLLFRRMLLDGVFPDDVTFTVALKACSRSENFLAGKTIHSLAHELGYDLCMTVCTALINMYAECGSLQEAVQIFERMQKRDDTAWTAMLCAYAQFGHVKRTLATYSRMLLEGIAPSQITFAALINACVEHRKWVSGRSIHCHIIEKKMQYNHMVAIALINMYGRGGKLKKVRRIFRKMSQPDLLAYNTLLNLHVVKGQLWNALQLFRKLETDGVTPNQDTLLVALAACVQATDLEEGKSIHVSAINHGLESNIRVGNALIKMYSRCGSLRDAEWMFQRMEKPDKVSWSSLIVACVKNDSFTQALSLFRKMQLHGFVPNTVVLVNVLRACAKLKRVEEGKEIHKMAMQLRLDSNAVRNEMLKLYGVCGTLDDVKRTFHMVEQPDVASWNNIIVAYREHGHTEATSQFRRMQLEGVEANRKTFCTILVACSSLEDINNIQACILESRYNESILVRNALLTALGKFQRIEAAEQVFHSMQRRNQETWNLMFAMYGRDPSCSRAIKLFQEMLLYGIRPGATTFFLLLNACMEDTPCVASVEFVHALLRACDCEHDMDITTCLSRLYMKKQ